MKFTDSSPGRLRRVFLAVVLATGVAVTGALMPGVASAGTTWSAPVTLATGPGTPSPALVTAGQRSGTAVVAWTGNGRVSASVRTPPAG